MTPALAAQFLNDHLPSCSCEQLNSGKYHQAGSAITLVMTYLTTMGFLVPAPEPPSPWPEGIASLLSRYDTFLKEIHGLADTTRATHRYRATQFLLWWRVQDDTRELSALTAQDLLAYQQTNMEERHSVDWQKNCLGVPADVRPVSPVGANHYGGSHPRRLCGHPMVVIQPPSLYRV